ncbi:MAG: potassium-transporting ATPase subunit KdpC [Candidatus Margulisiibacteriota bacterium]
MKNIAVCLKLFIVTTLLTGLIYPLFVTLIGQAVFPDSSNGSLLTYNGRVVGSKLIGQKFDQGKYFWPRPSATEYNPLPSGGSNLSPTSRQLAQTAEERKQKLLLANPGKTEKDIPADLLSASASGLDPHISVAAAKFQVARIAAARQFDSAKKDAIIKLIDQLTEGRDFKIFGEKRVNVLRLNVEMDNLH